MAWSICRSAMSIARRPTGGSGEARLGCGPRRHHRRGTISAWESAGASLDAAQRLTYASPWFPQVGYRLRRVVGADRRRNTSLSTSPNAERPFYAPTEAWDCATRRQSSRENRVGEHGVSVRVRIAPVAARRMSVYRVRARVILWASAPLTYSSVSISIARLMAGVPGSGVEKFTSPATHIIAGDVSFRSTNPFARNVSAGWRHAPVVITLRPSSLAALAP